MGHRHNITKEQLLSCQDLTRNEAAELLRIDLNALWRAAVRNDMGGIFKDVRKPTLTKELLLNNDGMKAYPYSKKIGYRAETVYAAIRRFGIHEHFGLQKHSGSGQQ